MTYSQGERVPVSGRLQRCQLRSIRVIQMMKVGTFVVGVRGTSPQVLTRWHERSGRDGKA